MCQTHQNAPLDYLVAHIYTYHMGKVMEPALVREAEVFKTHLEEWRKTHMGQFVLIKGEAVEFYDSLTAAFSAGTKRYGLDDFFIKQIIPRDTVNVSFMGKHLYQA